MDNWKVRLVTATAELLWVATLTLLSLAMVYQAGGYLAMWGLASSAAAAAATVSAVTMCAGTKVIRAVTHRQAVAEAEDLLRRREF